MFINKVMSINGTMGAWSSGMILDSGSGGLGFDSRSTPADFLNFLKLEIKVRKE